MQTHRKGIPSTHAHLEQFSETVEKSGFTCLHEHIINSALALAMITDETDVMQLQAEHKKTKHFPFFLPLHFYFYLQFVLVMQF